MQRGFACLALWVSGAESAQLNKDFALRQEGVQDPDFINNVCGQGVADTCKIIGDPHVTRFDKKWISLLEQNESLETEQTPEAKYIVWDNDFNIQGQFGGNGPLLLRLDVGGPFLEDGILVVEPEVLSDGSAGKITWNGEALFTDGTYKGFSAVAEGGGELFRAEYSDSVIEVKRGDSALKRTVGYNFYFQGKMMVTVNRKKKSLNVAVTRCRGIAGFDFHDEISDLNTVYGMCGGSDQPVTSTLTPQSNPCASGTCNVYGDPHITRPDGRWLSLLSVNGAGEMLESGRGRSSAIQKPGDFWLVKSKAVSVQARFGRNGPMMTHVALGGELTGGNVIVIGASKDSVTYNGNVVQAKLPSSVNLLDCCSLSFEEQTSLVQRRDGISKSVPGVLVKLPRDVQLTVNRLAHSINVAITMCEDVTGKFQGYCGSVEDDRDPMLLETQSPFEVGVGESMFSF